MAKLEYLSSFDELTWRIDFSRAHSVRVDIPWTARPEVRSWIDRCCSDTVWIWNGTSTPAIGDQNWGKIMCPNESVTYIIFENIEDCELFMLKYTSEFCAVYYGNDMYKAWHDSRSTK